MKRGTVVVVAVAGGVVVLGYVYRDSIAALFPAPRNKSNLFGLDLGGLMDQLNTSLGNLRDENSAEREGLRNAGRSLQRAAADLGILGARKHERRKENLSKLAASSLSERLGAEKYARKHHSYASRADVREWSATGEGVAIYYEGRADPFILPVPREALNPSAWVIEAPSRLLAPVSGGAVPQAERGPFGTSVGLAGKVAWLGYEEPAFSDNNPAAPRDMTISGLYNPPTLGLVQPLGEEGAAA